MSKVNFDKHIWEGWTVKSFIDEIEPTFNYIQDNMSHIKKFTKDDKDRLKNWLKDFQPYYKKHIPDVFNYFWNKLK